LALLHVKYTNIFSNFAAYLGIGWLSFSKIAITYLQKFLLIKIHLLVLLCILTSHFEKNLFVTIYLFLKVIKVDHT